MTGILTNSEYLFSWLNTLKSFWKCSSRRTFELAIKLVVGRFVRWLGPEVTVNAHWQWLAKRWADLWLRSWRLVSTLPLRWNWSNLNWKLTESEILKLWIWTIETLNLPNLMRTLLTSDMWYFDLYTLPFHAILWSYWYLRIPWSWYIHNVFLANHKPWNSFLLLPFSTAFITLHTWKVITSEIFLKIWVLFMIWSLYLVF